MEQPMSANQRSKKKRKRLSAFEFSQIIVEKGLKNRTDALAFAFMQKNEGKTDLAEFIINRGVKTVNEAIVGRRMSIQKMQFRCTPRGTT